MGKTRMDGATDWEVEQMSQETVQSRAHEVWSRFEIGRIVPDFKLPSLDGGEISPSDFKEKNGLAILYFDIERSDDWAVLWEFALRARQFEEANAQVLPVASATKEEAEICLGELKLPFPMLYEDVPAAEQPERPDHPRLFVADRFGEVREIYDVTARNVDEVLDKAIAVLDLAELECPECGAPTWSI